MTFRQLLHYTNKLKDGGKSWERNIIKLKKMLNKNASIKKTLQELTK